MVGIDLAKGTTPLRTVFDTKSFFKPLNIRIKNIQANKLWYNYFFKLNTFTVGLLVINLYV